MARRYSEICPCNPANGGSGICGCIMGDQLIDDTKSYITTTTTPEPITMIDPPSGWKYGFPKPIPKDRLKDVNTWLIEQGYPQSEIDSLGEHFYCRYWEE